MEKRLSFKRLFVIALLAAIPSFFATPAAKADNVGTNQWYSVSFADNPSPLTGPPYGTQVNGPVLPSGFANSVAAPDGTAWTITLAPYQSGTLTVTDVETSGDQFQMFDNGVPMSPAASPFTALGQNPGQVSPGGGLTSIPCDYCEYGVSDINYALGDANYSSATFALYPGVNIITGEYIGVVSYGDADFIAEVTPEPSSLALFGTGLLGVLVTIRRKLMA